MYRLPRSSGSAQRQGSLSRKGFRPVASVSEQYLNLYSVKTYLTNIFFIQTSSTFSASALKWRTVQRLKVTVKIHRGLWDAEDAVGKAQFLWKRIINWAAVQRLEVWSSGSRLRSTIIQFLVEVWWHKSG